jgi:hypothetical protein
VSYNKYKPHVLIGYALVEECPDSLSELWDHPLLEHNRDEARRLMARVNSFLFY